MAFVCKHPVKHCTTPSNHGMYWCTHMPTHGMWGHGGGVGGPLTSNTAPFDTMVLKQATRASTWGLWLAHGNIQAHMWCCTRAMHSLLLEIGKWVACISKKQLNGCYCSSTRLYRHTQLVSTCIWGMAGHRLPKLSHGPPKGHACHVDTMKAPNATRVHGPLGC